MRTILVASAVALAITGCDDASRAPDRASAATVPTMVHMDQIGMEGGRGVFVARRDAGETRIAFAVPLDRVDPQRRHDMERVGETGDGVVVVIDRYATRAADGRCVDGRESFVRVFSLPLRRELMARALESCRDRLVSPEPAVTWLDSGGFRIEGPKPQSFAIRGVDTVQQEAPHG